MIYSRHNLEDKVVFGEGGVDSNNNTAGTTQTLYQKLAVTLTGQGESLRNPITFRNTFEVPKQESPSWL